MKLTIPELSLVALVGVSGSGKSTFARKHFKPTEVLSSDFCRGLVRDDANDQDATNDAFEILHAIARKRLAAGKLTVVDATNVQPESRKPLVELARAFHCLPVAIVLDVPERLCHERNASRVDRAFGPHVIRNQSQQLHRALRSLEREGFRHVFILSSVEEVEQVELVRERLWNNRRDDHGPFDLIGDIHGCRSELETLLGKLGYDPTTRTHPLGRRVIFLGDLVDRGPDAPGVLRIAMKMRAEGTALVVPGNHEMKLLRKLRGKDVKLTHGLAETMEQLDRETPEFKREVASFIDDLVSHYVLDDGKLVVAHAGMKEELQGRGSGKVREFALYGETTGETDEFGLPVRFDWARGYRGKARVVYGHTPVPEAEWLNGTLCIDTGCVFGGKLTALRYPEQEVVSVPAERVWCVPVKPLAPAPTSAFTAQQEVDDVLDATDVMGKRLINTRLLPQITLREENTAAALEVMSRFAVNPKWLIYLPPTMAPTKTADSGAHLEHPAEVFTYFRHEGVPRVICEEKHMGSRAVVIVCRDEAVAMKRFGVREHEAGIVVTRTGRRFFADQTLELAVLQHVREAMDRANFWTELSTDWACLDCELMPWSAKAQELIRTQYAAVGAAARASLGATVEALETARREGREVSALLEHTRARAAMAAQYVDTYRRYCWPVEGVAELRLAPFHVLATEGFVHTDKTHVWHLEQLAKVVAVGGPLLTSTEHRVVDLTNDVSQANAIAWWEALTAAGGEGMVVKPVDFIARGPRGVVQPAVKCRGAEYLRLIYGPEYSQPENLTRLRKRHVGAKRSLAMREFALGVEALERFVRREPLRRVHECVFGVLALESEPVDPRL